MTAVGVLFFKHAGMIQNFLKNSIAYAGVWEYNLKYQNEET